MTPSPGAAPRRGGARPELRGGLGDRLGRDPEVRAPRPPRPGSCDEKWRPGQRQRHVHRLGRPGAGRSACRGRCRASLSAETSKARSRPNQTTRPARRSPMRRRRGSSPFSTATPPGARPSRISALASAIASTDVEELQVHRRHVRDHRHVGPRDVREGRAARPPPTCPAPAPPPCARRSRRSSVSGRPYWLLRLPSVLSTGPARREQRGRHLLGGGLAGRAGDRDDRDAGRLPRRGAPGRRAPAWCRRRARAAGPRAPARRGGPGAAAAPRRAASARKSWPSKRGPAMATNSCAGREGARVDRDAREAARPPGASTPRGCRRSRPRTSVEGAWERAQDLRPHAFPLCTGSRRSSVAGHLPVVEGHRAVAQHLVGLVALARDHHHVARARHLEGAGDRVAPVDDDVALGPAAAVHAALDLLDDRLGRLAARVVRGDDDHVREPRGHGAHQRALAAVAVAAAAEDRDHAARPQLAHGLEQVLERVVGVGVVDDHREVLAGVHALQPARHAAQRREAARRPLSGATPRARAAPSAASRFCTLKRPSSGVRTSKTPTGVRGPEARALPARARSPSAREVGGALDGVGPHAAAGGAGELGGPVVVGVDDGVSVLPQQRVEQDALGGEVAVHVAVEVEVVAGQVGEDRHPEARSRGRASGPASARRPRAPRGGSRRPPSRGTAPAGRRTRASCARPRPAGRRSGTGPCRAGPPRPGRAQGGVDQVGRGGLAVRAGDADELEGSAGAAAGPRPRASPAPRARRAPGARACPAAAAPRRRRRPRPSCGRRPRTRLPSVVEAADRHEQRSRPRLARVVASPRSTSTSAAPLRTRAAATRRRAARRASRLASRRRRRLPAERQDTRSARFNLRAGLGGLARDVRRAVELARSGRGARRPMAASRAERPRRSGIRPGSLRPPEAAGTRGAAGGEGLGR